MEFFSPAQYASKVITLSRRMLLHAQCAEWETFAGLESERAQVLQQLFAHPAMPGALQELQSMLQEVVELDRQAIELGEQEKHRLGEILASRRQARRAMRAYQHTHNG